MTGPFFSRHCTAPTCTRRPPSAACRRAFDASRRHTDRVGMTRVRGAIQPGSRAPGVCGHCKTRDGRKPTVPGEAVQCGGGGSIHRRQHYRLRCARLGDPLFSLSLRGATWTFLPGACDVSIWRVEVSRCHTVRVRTTRMPSEIRPCFGAQGTALNRHCKSNDANGLDRCWSRVCNRHAFIRQWLAPILYASRVRRFRFPGREAVRVHLSGRKE